MFLFLKDSAINVYRICAVTKGNVPATHASPEFFVMNVYLENLDQPLMHTYLDESERDQVYQEVCGHLNELQTIETNA